MIPIVYYAHSMRIYGTEQETQELESVQTYFDVGLIFNPNCPRVQRAKDPMRECLHVVKDPSVTSLVFSAIRGRIEAGVYAEIRSAQKQEKMIYYVDFEQNIHEFHGMLQKIPGKPIKYKVLL